MLEFTVIVTGVIIIASTIWMLGYYYGVKTFRDRNRKMIAAIKDSNKVYKEWADSPEGTNWESGYQTGVTTTLNSLLAFIDRASD